MKKPVTFSFSHCNELQIVFLLSSPLLMFKLYDRSAQPCKFYISLVVLFWLSISETIFCDIYLVIITLEIQFITNSVNNDTAGRLGTKHIS